MAFYGNKVTKAIIDEDGSIKKVKEIYQGGVMLTKFVAYEQRVKVKNEKEELAEVLRFRKEHPERHNVSIRIESSPDPHKQDYYYVVKCWEVEE
jgi:hypothetical protein